MIPTSGTTGRSKLVMQTHLAYVMAGEGFPFWMQLTSDDRLMTSLPLFHINAPAYSTLGSIAARASLALLPGFSASSFLDDARRFGATEFNSIGAMLEILVRQPPRADDADNPIRLCYTGPSPDREHQLEIEARFGFEIVCGYALSETPYALVWRHGERPYGTLGSARQHPDARSRQRRARRSTTAGSVAAGEIGELELRNPAIMRGYYEMPEETAAVIVDGWLRTGDLVRVNDDETYTFLGRKKEVIRRRGENLSPAEVEAALERHPDVAEAAVIGVPSDLSEEDVKAFVVAAPGAHARSRRAARVRAASSSPLTRCRATSRSSPSCRTRRPTGWRSTGCRATARRPKWTSRSGAGSLGPDGEQREHRLGAHVDRRRDPRRDPRRRPRPAEPRSWAGSRSPSSPYLLVTKREPTAAADARCSTRCSCRSPTTASRRARSRRGSPTPARRRRSRARSPPACSARAACSSARPATPRSSSSTRCSDRRAGERPTTRRCAAIAEAAVDARRAAGERVPGLGHPVHKDVDPRTPRLYAIAAEDRVCSARTCACSSTSRR